MPDDLRIKLGWPNNLKRQKLQRRLGEAGVLAVIDLWCYAGSNCPKGILGDVSADDLALMARWKGDPKEFLQALLEGPWIIKTGKKLALNGWKEHQPFLYFSEERSDLARENAEKRWKKERANGMPTACRQHTLGNAPTQPTQPTQPTRKERTSDPSRPIPESVAVYRQFFHLQLNVIQRDEVAKIVISGEDVDLWTSILKAWSMKGWNPRNVEGMLDCFRKGGITNKDESGLNQTQRAVMESRRRRLEREGNGEEGNGGADDLPVVRGTARQKNAAGGGGYLPGAAGRHSGRSAGEGCEPVPADVQVLPDNSGDSG